jgi:cytochrome c biogenesis protein CcmG/thiol:disulfide interchange protein DsbE
MTDLDESTAAGDGERGARRRPVAPFVVLAVALVLGGLFVVLAGAEPRTDQTAATPFLDAPAPEVRGELADGREFDLSRRKGSWVVLNFFTSTCIPCQAEHPELIRFVEQQRALGTDGAEFYTVVVDDRREAVEDFFAEEGGDWPIVYDPEGRFSVAFGVAKVPETWIIDPNGIVRGRVISQVTAEFLGTQLQQLREGV